MGKIESTKVIRVWILGATFCATVFLALSIYHDFWAMKVFHDYSKGVENITYFGLWQKCFYHKGVENGYSYVTLDCEKYGDGNLAGITDTPGFIKMAQGFLILMTAIMAIATILCGIFMTCSRRPMIYITSIPTLAASVIGIIVIGIFMGKLGGDADYEDYTAAWTFYYFLIGWFFTMSTFGASVVDKSEF